MKVKCPNCTEVFAVEEPVDESVGFKIICPNCSKPLKLRRTEDVDKSVTDSNDTEDIDDGNRRTNPIFGFAVSIVVLIILTQIVQNPSLKSIIGFVVLVVLILLGRKLLR